LNQQVLPVDLEIHQSERRHIPPTDQVLHPRLRQPLLLAIFVQEQTHRLKQRDRLVR
jgi:hypothetical protein